MGPYTSWRRILGGAIIVSLSAVTFQYYRSDITVPEILIDSSIPHFNSTGQSPVCVAVATSLPGSTYSAQHPVFQHSKDSYWSRTACEVEPSCIVRPVDAHEVATVVKILKKHFDSLGDSEKPSLFAVRSGGHAPEAGFASLHDGLVIDMGLIREVTVSEDKQKVVIGAGARWVDVYSKLDAQGLAMVGGRSAAVGVGGLVLGGGISFFSPRFGMVCDNIDLYELVLANGSVIEAASSRHEDLWRALKGGTGNLGIVTRVTATTFVSSNIWGGYAFYLGYQATKILEAFVGFNRPENFDEYAAGPLVALTYVQQLGFSIIAVNLAYTKPESWAPVFDGFRRVWRVWGTSKVQSLTSATQELENMALPGRRQFQATTTVLNDLETLNAFRESFQKHFKEFSGVKSLVSSLVFQPLSAAVTRKGSPNVLGLGTREANETLIIVLISVSWSHAEDDERVHRTSRAVISMGEDYARKQGTADNFRYLNYAASGQDPLAGYGAANILWLKETSKKYDPDRFFQIAKQGGFKLDFK